MLLDNIPILEEAILSRRRLNRDVARSLVGCSMDASLSACDALNVPLGTTWGEVAQRALFRDSAASQRRMDRLLPRRDAPRSASVA